MISDLLAFTSTWTAEFGRTAQLIHAAWQSVPRPEPWFSLILFIGAAVVMIWRLGALERKGLEGTVLGTLIMPYASGFSNLVFAFIIGRSGGSGSMVLENCLVNNATNFTLLIGLPALIWGLNLFPGNKAGRGRGLALRTHRLNRLSLMLTISAVLFFSGILWALMRDKTLDFGDGLVLVSLFLFWQLIHVFDVLKHNIQRGRTLRWTLAFDIAWVLICGAAVYTAIEQLVQWIPRTGSGWLVFANLGWLSGMLMTLPNALPAFYYARAGRSDIVYSSQIGDGHICIPMCIGLTALFVEIQMPIYFDWALGLIVAAALVHLICVSIFGRLPRWMGLLCTAVYGWFIFGGLLPL